MTDIKYEGINLTAIMNNQERLIKMVKEQAKQITVLKKDLSLAFKRINTKQDDTAKAGLDMLNTMVNSKKGAWNN